ncbi:MAG: flagellar M-ring protein FliF [Chloroflexi bacterium]|nr:flagellar M-ring protein FliF [Chloroflexota bacterium]
MLNQIRQQFGTFWDKQSRIQRAVLAALVAVAIVLIAVFLVWAGTPTYGVAFSGLSEADAGVIVEKLNEENIPYQLRDSGTILVPSSQVYDVRLMMAREGLPQGGSVGFEIFSGNTLGMTEFTQRVNYQQAMEGELERTIGSLNAVEAVRVHIVTPEKSLIASNQLPTTASVTVKERPGMHLDIAQVRSITHLVASSVEGLPPENVVVVDVNGNLLASGESGDDATLASQSDSHREAEVLAARELQAKVQNLLDTALGPNKSVVQASVTMDWTERETTTQQFNPDTAALRSSQFVQETYTTTNATLAGLPGAVSNLPVGETGLLPENQAVVYTRTEQITNYELTEMQSHEIAPPGSVQRISLSVLVDGVTDATQLATLQEVIAAAAGIDAARGDMLAVETLAFDRTYYETQAAEMESTQRTDLYVKIGIAVAAALILAILFWYILRLLNNLKLASAEAWTPILRPVAEVALPGMGAAPFPQFQPSPDKAQPMMMEQTMSKSEPQIESRPALQPFKLELPELTEEDTQLQSLIQELANEDPSSLAGIIQLWLSEDDRGNG